MELARRLDDPLAECAALDALTGAQHRAGDTFAAAATARRRVDMLSSVPVTPASADELVDTLLMAVETSIGVGDLHGSPTMGPAAARPAAAGRGRPRRHVSAPGGGRPGRRRRRTRSPPAAGSSTAGPTPAAHGPPASARGRRGRDGPRPARRPRRPSRMARDRRPAGRAPRAQGRLQPHVRRHRPAPPWTGDPRPRAARGRDRRTGAQKWLTWIWLHWHVALRAEAAVLAAAPTPAATSQPPAGRRRQPHRHRDRRPRRSPARPGSRRNSSRPRPHSTPLAVPTRPPEP